MKKILLLILCLLTVSFVLFTFSPIFAEVPKKLLKYLPQDEAIESVNKEYNPPLRKSGISCQAAFEEASRCFYCVNTLKTKCPDCCMKFSPQRAARCTPKGRRVSRSRGVCGYSPGGGHTGWVDHTQPVRPRAVGHADAGSAAHKDSGCPADGYPCPYGDATANDPYCYASGHADAALCR